MIIDKYNDFVFESKVFDLLLEGKFEMDVKFLKILSGSCAQSDLGKKILSFIKKNHEIPDIDLKQNYISIVPEKPDTISFVAQSKYNSLLQRDPEGEGSKSPFIIKGRSEIKIGRFLKAVCELAKITHTDKEMEDLVNIFKSLNVDDSEKLYLVEGDDIKYWYNTKRYLNTDGDLGNSCMRYDECQTYFKIYTKNPEKVKMLILTTTKDGGEKLIGRAIVWTLDDAPCPKPIMLMDRVYCSKDSDKYKFSSYADKQGWLKKSNNSAHGETKFKLGTKTFTGRVAVSISKGNYRKYPYMDTLNFINHDKTEISNVGFAKGYDMSNTDGSLDTCSNCNGTGIEICSMCNGKGYDRCDSCGGEGKVDCPECNGNGKYHVTCNNCLGNIKDRLAVRKFIAGALSVVKCEECDGEGTVVSKKTGNLIKCKSCKSTGKQICPECNGSRLVEVDCEECNGKGRVVCDECEKGRVVCDDCHGKKIECGDCVGILRN